MKTRFNIQMIFHIATLLATYKKLFVTTEGVMFPKLEAAEEAVRTKNMIIDDPAEYVGIATITQDMVTDAKLREYGKNPETFAELFKDAKIPRMRPQDKAQDQGRQFEKPRVVERDVSDKVAKALGMAEDEGAGKKARKSKEAEKASEEEAEIEEMLK